MFESGSLFPGYKYPNAAAMLENIRIVLINTSHPGNIGAAARAMKNMGLSDLRLVAPKLYPHEKAVWRAASAADVLDQAVVHETLEDAVQGCQLVIGTSARDRSIPWPVMNAREAAETVLQEPGNNKVALLFGREDRGLTNEELQQCNFHLQIPTNDAYSSLNLAAAVQVACYELRMAALARQEMEGTPGPKPDWGVEWDAETADADELRRLFEHMEEALVQLEVINPKNPRQLMTRLKRLVLRSRPDKVEVNLLRGVFSAAQKLVK